MKQIDGGKILKRHKKEAIRYTLKRDEL